MTGSKTVLPALERVVASSNVLICEINADISSCPGGRIEQSTVKYRNLLSKKTTESKHDKETNAKSLKLKV